MVGGDLPPPSREVERLREDFLRAGGTIEGIVRGTSMAPLLLPGDRVRVGPPGRPPACGDILAFRRDGNWVVHRCLATREGELLERGDHAGPPGTISPDRVPGIVVEVIRGHRRLILDGGLPRRLGRLAALVGRLGLELGPSPPGERPPPWTSLVLSALARLAWRTASREVSP